MVALRSFDSLSELDAYTFDHDVEPTSEGIARSLTWLSAPVQHRRRKYEGRYVAKPEDEARSNALPEGIEYHDDGCDLAPACLSCPFPDCRFDLPRGAQTIQSKSNMDRFVELRTKGASVLGAGRQLGVSKRTAQRWAAVLKAGAR